LSHRFDRRLLATVLVLFGFAVSAGGLLQLRQLSQIYRIVDIAYAESEQTFHDWLAGATNRYDRDPRRLADLIADRLVTMGVYNRSKAVNAMMTNKFWDELAPPGVSRRPRLTLMTRATSNALKSSPLSGELWLFAAWLRTKTTGFDDTAADYFLASQRYAPREEWLVLRRLDFATDLANPLPDELKAAAMIDLSIANLIAPARAQHYIGKIK
jgi:hypothetical protein